MPTRRRTRAPCTHRTRCCRGWFARGRLARAALLVNVLDLAILVVLAVYRGLARGGFALGGFVLSVAYTAPPLRLKKRGLGEPDVFLVWGPLMVGGTYYAAVGHLPWEIIVASVPYGLLCTAVLMGKHIDKAPFDEPLGIRTLPVVLGERRARAATIGMMVAFYVTVVGVRGGAGPSLARPPELRGRPQARPGLEGLQRAQARRAPAGFPVWPLWFAAVAFVHTRRAGSLLVLGLIIAAIANIR